MATANMAAPSFSLTPELHWTDEKERALIAFFSKHSCLWNHKSENYKNRHLRWKTLEHLRILLSAHPPPVRFTVEDIKNKFKNLRTTFQRQYKMVKASKVCRSEDEFVPQWKHYQQLMFLQGCWDQEDKLDMPLSPLTDPQEGLVISFLPTQSTSSSPSSSSSCVQSNMMVKSFWTEEREREVIAFYSEHNCLWNKKDENHSNRQLRTRLLEALRSKLSDHTVTFSVEDVKCKFKNLRTVFHREYKAVEASDKLYVSKWKHYQQMLFLCESCDDDDGQDDVQIVTPKEEREQEHGNQTPSSTLSSFSSSSTKTLKFNSPSAPSCDVVTNQSAAYQIFITASPDDLKLENQTAAPALPAPSSSLITDYKPCTDVPHQNFSASVSVQPDIRLSVDSRCQWNEAKVQQLISFYSEHSCLWNHKSESYRNRLLRQSLLEMLSNVLSSNEPVPFTVEDIKTKFRNLRTIFQREHKAVSSNKICGSEDFYLPKWKHYRDLMFLCDSCDEDERPDNVHYQEPQEPRLLHLDSQALPPPVQYNSSTQTTVKLNLTAQKMEAPPSPTPPDSQRSSPSSSPCTSPSSHNDSRVLGRKRASRRPPPAPSSELLDFMRTLCQSQTASPHAGFLKYVEECLNETPPDKVKKLKKKIIETIHNVSEEV